MQPLFALTLHAVGSGVYVQPGPSEIKLALLRTLDEAVTAVLDMKRVRRPCCGVRTGAPLMAVLGGQVDDELLAGMDLQPQPLRAVAPQEGFVVDARIHIGACIGMFGSRGLAPPLSDVRTLADETTQMIELLVERFAPFASLFTKDVAALRAQAAEASLEQKRELAMGFLQTSDAVIRLCVPRMHAAAAAHRTDGLPVIRTLDAVEIGLVRVSCADAKQMLAARALELSKTVMDVVEGELRVDVARINAAFEELHTRLAYAPTSPEEMVELRQFCDGCPAAIRSLSEEIRQAQVRAAGATGANTSHRSCIGTAGAHDRVCAPRLG
jgi:hypothetical protein